jgi:hypothetical protein
MAATWSSDHSPIYHNLHLRLAIANDLSLAIGVIMIDRKVIIMKLGYQFNSYHLMHIQESNKIYMDNSTQGWWLDARGLALVLLIVTAPRLVLAPVVPRVLAPRGLSQICKYETPT